MMIETFCKRTYDRTIWSVAGMRDAWVNELSFRHWFVANLMSAALALWLPLTPGERAVILAVGVLVLAAELMNTGIERVVDLVTQEHHELAGRAKDAASGAVMVTACAVGVAWACALLRLFSTS